MTRINYVTCKDEDVKTLLDSNSQFIVTLASDSKHPPMTNSEINQAFPATVDVRACTARKKKLSLLPKKTGARKATYYNKYLFVAQGRDVSLNGILVRPFLHRIWLWNYHSYKIGLKKNNRTK